MKREKNGETRAQGGFRKRPPDQALVAIANNGEFPISPRGELAIENIGMAVMARYFENHELMRARPERRVP